MHYQQLSIEERELIERMLWDKAPFRAIAARLGRSVSSISREVKRHNRVQHTRYTPRLAHARALEKRRSRGRTERLKNHHIRAYVIEHLTLRWSPEQIAGRIAIDLKETISHEAIYQFIYAQVKNGSVVQGGIDLRGYLRRRRKRRIPHGARRGQRVVSARGKSIDERPSVVAYRTRLGDWEGDTIESCDHKPGVNTLVERKTGILMVTKVKNKSSIATSAVVTMRLNALPRDRKHTLTLDNGPENSDWKSIEYTTGLRTFFAHPYHSWERGTNENTNGLIRDFFPKKTDFTLVPDADITAVEYALNTRPRKRLNYRTPLEAWGCST